MITNPCIRTTKLIYGTGRTNYLYYSRRKFYSNTQALVYPSRRSITSIHTWPMQTKNSVRFHSRHSSASTWGIGSSGLLHASTRVWQLAGLATAGSRRNAGVQLSRARRSFSLSLSLCARAPLSPRIKRRELWNYANGS